MRQGITIIVATAALVSCMLCSRSWSQTAANEIIASHNRAGAQFSEQVKQTAVAVYNARADLNRAILERRNRHDAIEQQESAEAEAKKRSLAQLVAAMKPNPALDHLPDHLGDTDRAWNAHYVRIANGLKGNVTYKFEANGLTGKRSDLFEATDQHVNYIRGNLKVIAWYREQLEQKSSGESAPNHRGAYWLALLLDELMETLAQGMPRVKISLDGEIREPVLELEERTLWHQLSCIYRYLYFKLLVYENSGQFVPADLAFMDALQKLLVLYGAEIDPGWFETVKVDLTDPNVQGWKRTARMALLVLQMKADGDTKAQQEIACVIPIPEKPKPQAPKPPQPEERKVRIVIEGVGVPDK